MGHWATLSHQWLITPFFVDQRDIFKTALHVEVNISIEVNIRFLAKPIFCPPNQWYITPAISPGCYVSPPTSFHLHFSEAPSPQTYVSFPIGPKFIKDFLPELKHKQNLRNSSNVTVSVWSSLLLYCMAVTKLERQKDENQPFSRLVLKFN